MIKTVAVTGNCQSSSIARCVAAMLPGSEVIPFQLSQVRKDPLNDKQPEWLDWMAKCDLVLCMHQKLKEPLAAFRAENLKETCKLVVEYPSIAFNGFHPDCTYIHTTNNVQKNKGLVRGVMGPYHSAFVAACFLEKIPQERVPDLFNMFTYSFLNYRTAFDVAANNLQGVAKPLGFDFSQFLDVSSPRVFMHVVNHPKIEILYEVACQGLRMAGIAFDEIDVTRLEDGLAKGAVWPVYAGLPGHAGTSDPITFRPRLGQTISLEDFIRGNYRSYAADPPLADDPTLARARTFLQENFLAAA